MTQTSIAPSDDQTAQSTLDVARRAFKDLIPEESLLSLLPDNSFWTVKTLEGADLDGKLQEFEDRINAPLPASVESDVSRWERGWGEIYDRLRTEGFDKSLLVPQYYRYDTLALNGQLTFVSDPMIEHHLFDLLRRHLIQTHSNGSTHLCEIGCGAGQNLVTLHEEVPSAKISGTDWTQASKNIVSTFPAEMREKISCYFLDMLTLERDDGLNLDKDTTVFTFLSMEQLGDQFVAITEHLLDNKVNKVVQVEPLYELYDPALAYDKYSSRYHEKRNYLRGYLPFLKDQEAKGRLKIETLWKGGFGSRFHNPYSVVIWSPTEQP
ncbi:hypothetical protein ACTL6U_10055 [Rhodovibrionaceae bacterium A322]